MSSLPIPPDCSSSKERWEPAYGKTFKHWNDRPDYDYNSNYGEIIERSATLYSNGQPVLITRSYCQLQARLIKDPSVEPVHTSTNSSEVTFVDLCPLY